MLTQVMTTFRERNEILYFDFIFMGEIEPNLAYVLILRNDASSYVAFASTEAPDAISVVQGLLKWFYPFLDLYLFGFLIETHTSRVFLCIS